MGKYILLVCIIVLSINVYSQELTLNTTYFYNKQLFNPAFLGENNTSSINLINRRQWVGISDAPTIYYFNTQYKVNGNLAIGVNISNGKTALLNHFNGNISASYGINISADQGLVFGLSFGSDLNNLDLSSAENFDIDPVLLNSTGSSHHFDARFGIVYFMKSLKLGIALPQLLGRNSYNESEIKMSPFDYILFSTHYELTLRNPKFSLVPIFIYHYNLDLNDLWEAGIFINYNRLIEVGSTYKNVNEITAHLKLMVNDKFLIRYSYDFPQTAQKQISNGSHEIHLGYLFNRKKSNTRSNENDIRKISPQDTQLNINPSDLKDTETTTYQNMADDESVVDIKTIEVYSGSNPDFFELEKGYYISVGEFEKLKKAEACLSNVIKTDNIEAKIGYSSTISKHIVYIKYSNEINIIKEAYQNFGNMNLNFNFYCLHIY